jgi:hypothetical protein
MPQVDHLAGSAIHSRSLHQNTTILADMFVSVPSFGAKFLYTTDRAIQCFFKAVQNAENVEHLSDHAQSYLYNEATDLMDGIQESRAPVDIVHLHASGLPRSSSARPKSYGRSRILSGSFALPKIPHAYDCLRIPNVSSALPQWQ